MEQNQQISKQPVIGITIGDVNGIGPEVILKTLLNKQILHYCTPVVYGSSRVLSYYLKTLNLEQLPFTTIQKASDIEQNKVYVVETTQEKVIINMGEPSEETGKFALQALDASLRDLASGHLEGLVTAPLNKQTVNPEQGNFSGHTSYIADYFDANAHLMMMISETLKVALVTEHIALAEVPAHLTEDAIYQKLQLLHHSLEKDFRLEKGKIAVLGVNPHAGDSGLLGKEEHEIIAPAVQKAIENGIMAFGPYSADGFFGTMAHKKFDAVLAMFHDQGLIPFKTLAFHEGVNYTAGLPIVRTSPDHGTAYNLAGKNQADPSSMINALFQAIDIINTRKGYARDYRNPVKRTVWHGA